MEKVNLKRYVLYMFFLALSEDRMKKQVLAVKFQVRHFKP